jgi:hypothetical protein
MVLSFLNYSSIKTTSTNVNSKLTTVPTSRIHRPSGIFNPIGIFKTLILISYFLIPVSAMDCETVLSVWSTLNGNANVWNSNGCITCGQCCGKNGVVCNTFSSVTEIDWSNKALSGQVPFIISFLMELTSL